jgi:hypothetical protein
VEIATTTTVIYFSWTQSGTLVDRYTVSYTYTIRGTGSDYTVLTGNNMETGNGTRKYTLTELEGNSGYNITLTAIKGRRNLGTPILAITNGTGTVELCHELSAKQT